MIFVYQFEDHPRFADLTHEVFDTLQHKKTKAIASVLVVGEVLAGVKKARDEEMIARYRGLFLTLPNLTLLDADWAVMEQMSELRAKYGISTPDAIHLGTALAYGAEAFITNDARLESLTEINVLVLAGFAVPAT
jgi:predicted nucleic acid-binding protein